MAHPQNMAARRAVAALLLLCTLSLSTAPPAAAAPAANVPPCRKPANKTFEYYTYRMFWPPGIYAYNASAAKAALSLEAQGALSRGFWTHGLWPSSARRAPGANSGPSTPRQNWCEGGGGGSASGSSTGNVTEAALGPDLVSALDYWMPNPTRANFTEADNLQWWSREYQKHGSCTGMSPKEFFTIVTTQAAVKNPAVLAALAAGGVSPSNERTFAAADALAALRAAFGGAVSPGSLVCATDNQARVTLQEVELCLDADTLAPCDCHTGVPESTSAGSLLTSCFGGPGGGGAVYFNQFVTDASGFTHVPLRWLWTIIGALGGALALVAAAFWLARRRGWLRALFVPKARVEVVHNPLVRRPVRVRARPLDMAALREGYPELASFVDDLPAGMAIKGGVARRILKVLFGTPEPPGKYDVDCLVFLPPAGAEGAKEGGDNGGGKGDSGAAAAAAAAAGTGASVATTQPPAHDAEPSPEARAAAREAVAGLKIGPLLLEPQDVEVVAKEHLYGYFSSRDVSLNEVLIICHAPVGAEAGAPPVPHLYYTDDAAADAAAGTVRPGVHGLRTDLALTWAVDDDGTPYLMPRSLARVIIRYLKGHASDYQLDSGTWRHYRRLKLDKIALFMVLRPFHEDAAKLQRAVDHLIEVGFLSRLDVWRAGGVNLLWGLLLKEVNAVVSRYGARVTLGTMDPAAVEEWMVNKQMQVSAGLLSARLRARRTGFVASDESAYGLGLVSLPDTLMRYVANAPTFDISSAAAAAAATAAAADGGGGNGGGGGGLSAASAEQAASPPPPAPPVAERAPSAAALGPSRSLGRRLSASLSLRRRVPSFALDGGAGGRAPSSLFARAGSVRALAARGSGTLVAARGSGGALPAAGGLSGDRIDAGPADTDVAPALSLRGVGSIWERHDCWATGEDAGGGEGEGGEAGGVPARAAPSTTAAAATAAALAVAASNPKPPAAAKADGAERAAAADGGAWVKYSEAGAYDDAARPSAIGSFYQVWRAADVDGDPLVPDEEVKQKARVPAARLIRFVFSAMRPATGWLAAAYAVLLAGAGCQLYLPLLQGAVFNAISGGNVGALSQSMAVYAGLTAASLASSYFGGLLMEAAASTAMQPLYRRLFDHMLAQSPVALATVSPGELMSRTSGDAAVMYSLLTLSTYRVLEGFVLAFGSLGFLIQLFNLPYAGPRVFQSLVPTAMAVSLLEAAALAGLMRPVNLKLRQAMGRMFGFTLDVFTSVQTVTALGLQRLLAADYARFAADNFTTFAWYNVAGLSHRTFTAAMAQGLRVAALWVGGMQVIAGWSSLGELVAILKYLRLEQSGLKMFSDSLVRWSGAMGSLERLVQLHDRGVFQIVGGGGGAGDDKAAAGAVKANGGGCGGGGGGKNEPVYGGGGDGSVVAKDVEAQQHGGHGAGERRVVYAAASRAGRWLPTALYARLKGAAAPGELAALGAAAAADTAAKRGGGSKSSAAAVASGPPPLDPSRLTGGVKLEGAAISLRDRVQSVLLRNLDLTALQGEVLIVEGARGSGKSLVLQLLLLQLTPPSGRVMLQVAAGDGDDGGDGGGGGGKGGSGNSIWRRVDFLESDLAGLRARMALVSRAACGVFRASVEDNIACAATAAAVNVLPPAAAAPTSRAPSAAWRIGSKGSSTSLSGGKGNGVGASSASVKAVTQAAVREAATSAGLHGVAMSLPEGYRTVVGDGTGVTFPEHVALRLALARALVRAPALLLVDDAERVADAMPGGYAALARVLASEAQRGAAVVCAARLGGGGGGGGSDAPAELAAALRAAGVEAVRALRVEGGTLVGA